MDKYDPEETKRKIAELKAQNEYLLEKMKLEREREEKRRQKREWFDLIFPEFRDVPIIWLVIGFVCVLFGIFTLII